MKVICSNVSISAAVLIRVLNLKIMKNVFSKDNEKSFHVSLTSVVSFVLASVFRE